MLTGQKVKDVERKDEISKILQLVLLLLLLPGKSSVFFLSLFPSHPELPVWFFKTLSLFSHTRYPVCTQRSKFPARVQLDVRQLVTQQFPPGTMGACLLKVAAAGKGGGGGGNTRCEQEVRGRPQLAAV